MSSQPQNDQLLDLLYGELPPSEAAELRVAIENDEELANTWQELQESHREIQSHVPPPAEVSSSVQDAIMTAAKQHHADASPKRRQPSGATKKGLWGSLITGGSLQAGIAVAVVLLCFTAVIALFGEQIDSLFANASDEVSQVSLSHQSGGYGQRASAPPSHDGVQGVSLDRDYSSKSRAPARSESARAQDQIGSVAVVEEAEEEAEETGSSNESSLGALAQMDEPAPRPRPQRRARSAPPQEAPQNDRFADGLGLAGSGSGGGGANTRSDTLDDSSSFDEVASGVGGLGSASGRAAPQPAAPQPQAEAEPQQQAERVEADSLVPPSRGARQPAQEPMEEEVAAASPSISTDADEAMAEDADAEDADAEEEKSLVAQAEEALDDEKWDKANELLDEALADENISDDDRQTASRLRRRIRRSRSTDVLRNTDEIEAAPAAEPTFME